MDSRLMKNKLILWKQVWGLAVLHSAVSVSWLVYFFAQPLLLEATGFGALNAWFFLAAGLLALLIEPIAGFYADKIRSKTGNNYPVINLGVIATAMVFVVVALGLKLEIPPEIAWIVPVLMLLWISTMKIFQTPALSLIARSSPPEGLPQATAVLTLVGGLIGAIDPFIPSLVATSGLPLAFFLGGIVLLLAFGFMRKLGGSFNAYGSETEDSGSLEDSLKNAPTEKTIHGEGLGKESKLSLIFLAGFLIEIALYPLFFLFPIALSKASGFLIAGESGWGDDPIEALIFLVSALVAIPFGRQISKWGSRKGILLGIGLLFIAFLTAYLLILLTSTLSNLALAIPCILAGMGASLLLCSGLPFALENTKPEKAGLATGLFFGGGGLAAVVLNLLPVFTTDTGSGILSVFCGLALLLFFLVTPKPN